MLVRAGLAPVARLSSQGAWTSWGAECRGCVSGSSLVAIAAIAVAVASGYGGGSGGQPDRCDDAGEAEEPAPTIEETAPAQ